MNLTSVARDKLHHFGFRIICFAINTMRIIPKYIYSSRRLKLKGRTNGEGTEKLTVNGEGK